MKNRIRWAQLPLLASALICLCACTAVRGLVESPRISLVTVQPMEISAFTQRYSITLNIQNPNAVALPIAGMSYALRLAGHDFATGVTPESFSVPAYGDHDVQFVVSTNLLRSALGLAQWASGPMDTIDYEVNGKINVDLPLAGSIPVSQVGTFNLRDTR